MTMKTVAALLGILTLFLLAGVLPSPGGMQAAVFRSPVFVALLGVLSVLILVRAARNGRRPDFLLAHLGVVAILLGAFATYVWAVQFHVAVPVGDPRFTREAQTGEGRDAVPFGFGLRVLEFRIEYFAPMVPSDYRGVVEIATESHVAKRAELRVNHPVTFGGWRFHLMSCDEEGTLVYLSARRDPGRMIVIAGIWAVIVGVAAMCWRRSASKEVPRVA